MKEDFEIVSGGVQPETARAVAKIIGTKVLPVQLKEFPNGERYARLEQTVRNKNLFVFCTCATFNGYSLNDSLFEALIIADAAKRASAKEISIVLPLLPYSRQDRKARTREPITSALVLSMLKQAGIERVITVDLHSTQIQAAFSGPFENLSARKLISNRIKEYIQNHQNEDFVIIAPDAGSVKNSSKFANELEIPVIFLPKSRDEANPEIITRHAVQEDLHGKNCIIIDDMIDTGGTILSAANMLKESGAKRIIVCATHGVFSDCAASKIRDSAIDKIVVTDSVPQKDSISILKDKIEVVTIAPLLADAIRSINNGDNAVDID